MIEKGRNGGLLLGEREKFLRQNLPDLHPYNNKRKIIYSVNLNKGEVV